ncbi:copper chaperone PCu(A)C [Marilutibacter chinensis]|uniref:Copper chaperone PCu(A)C n=1 Tax=Marilutibacter chinensis TaxID=2912247 RepID=A0ABS9HWK5_9GAMM|nr:copper chaperone PCu(A)C [Lysobacter chinensis]MCF7222512.1 copper chaperone PCu(A)C [Lysobacter chinensis]
MKFRKDLSMKDAAPSRLPQLRSAATAVATAALLAACSPGTSPEPQPGTGAVDAPAQVPAAEMTASAPMPAGIGAGDAWMRAMPPGAKVAGGFLTLRNGGADADRLVSVRSPAAERVELHEMRTVDGMMKMRHLDEGLEIPAGGEVRLAPGSYHLMFMEPAQPFAEGDTVGATLVFEHAGPVEVEFQVLALGASGPSAGAGDGPDADGGHR